jgi:hypothetical protein
MPIRTSRSRSRSSIGRSSIRGSSIRRSSFRSRSSSSSFNRGFRVNGQPIRGPLGVVSLILFILFMLSFFSIFFLALFAPEAMFDFIPFFFFAPFIFFILFFITTIIATISTARRSIQGVAGVAGFYETALQQLFAVTNMTLQTIPSPDKYGPTFLTTYNRDQVLIKILPERVAYNSEVLQAITAHLHSSNSRLAWVIQQPPTFLETDNNYARFYNIELFNLQQFQTKIVSIQAEQKTTTQG